MKPTLIMTIALSLTLLGAGATTAQTGHDLFQQALVKERADGDLRGAIAIYERIAQEFAEDRALAAKALVQMGRCHEKLGNEDAQRAYRRVVQEYADQTEMAAEARARLTRLQQLAIGGTPPAGVALDEERSGLVLRRLRGDPGFVDGSPTPDGRRFAYVDYETGDVALWDLATGEHRRLTHEGSWVPPEQFAINVSVSPDGRSAAYSWDIGRDSVVELRVVGLDGTTPRTLRSNTDSVFYPMSWSPDARHLAVMVFNRVDTTGAIAWLSTEDGSIRRLARLPRWHWGELAHSSDGTFIAVGQPIHSDSGRTDIYLVATDGSGVIPLVRHPAGDRLVGWVPNSDNFLFLSDRSGDWDLWQVRVVGGRASGEPRVVKRGVGEIEPLGFAGADALFYALASWHFTTSVAPLDPSTGEIDEAARAALRDPSVAARWSPGGDRMALLLQTARGYDQFSLAIRNVATGEQRLLAPQLYPDQPSWFPDGRAILLPGFERDRPAAGQALYRVDVATGEATALLEFERDPTEYGLTPVGVGGLMQGDGRHLIYVHDGTLRQRDLSSGHEVELFRDPGVTTRLLALSPGGGELVFAVNDSTDAARPHPMRWLFNAGSLMLASLESGEVRDLVHVTGPGTIYGVGWTPDGRHLLFLQTRSGVGSVLFRVPREGGDAENVWQTKREIRDFALSPDGSWAAYAIVDAFSEFWTMENLKAVLER